MLYHMTNERNVRPITYASELTLPLTVFFSVKVLDEHSYELLILSICSNAFQTNFEWAP